MPSTPDAPALAAQLPERIGPFSIRGVLGRGGMGVVFDAVAPDGRRVALKVIRPYGDPDRSGLLVARFLREAKILEQLDHPGVVKLVASGETDGVLYLAMARIEGVSLLTIRRRGPLELEPLVVLGAQLCSALAHMHEAGVVHRDIKPANILIDKSGQPIITDFGISGLQEATGITRQGDLLGSPGFMAPEVIEGKTPTALSDQFSLGRLLYELGALGSAKRLPRGAPILEILQSALEIDWNRFPTGDRWDKLRAILEKMVAHDPNERFPSARLALAAFKALLGSDLLDSDTLSEQVHQLPVSTSWEALAQDLEIEEAEPPLDPFGDRTPAIPVRPTRPKYSGGEDEPTQLDLDLASDVMKPRDLAAILETKSDTSSQNAEMQQLLRTIHSLTRDLERERAKKPKSTSVAPWIALAFFALFAGAAAGWFGRIGQPPPPAVVIVPSKPDPIVVPKYAYDEKKGIPSDEDRVEAKEMLRAAIESLAKKDLGAAERLLGLCVDMADLPECHQLLGSILALTGDPAARAHLVRSVELAPNAPDAAAVKKALERTSP